MGYSAQVLVIGLGAMGSAALYQLARRNISAIGIDTYPLGHEQGSSHGETRITRQAIGEGLEYVPFALRAHQIWRELDQETGQSLLLTNGALIISNPVTEAKADLNKPKFLDTTIAAARQFHIVHEELDAKQVHAQFPQFALVDGIERAYFEPGAGLVYPERCIAAQLQAAERRGSVTIHRGRAVTRVEQTSANSVRVEAGGDTYTAETAIICAGSWIPRLLGGPWAQKLAIYRQVLHWFTPLDSSAYTPDKCPVFLWKHDEEDGGFFYGFPAVSAKGVKIAYETFDTSSPNPDEVNRETTDPTEGAGVYERHIKGRVLGLRPEPVASKVCLYTVTPDHRFIIDRDPGHDRLLVVSACSGHGFKHSAGIGESVVQLAVEGGSKIDLSPFALNRPSLR